MTNLISNKIILAKRNSCSAEEMAAIFEKASTADKVEFIGWFLDNFDMWEPRNVDLAKHTIEEISEVTGLSREYLDFINKDISPRDNLTDKVALRFSLNVPIFQLSKITSLEREKIDKIRKLRTRHPHCLDELLTLYFEIRVLTKNKSLEEFIRKSLGKKGRSNISASMKSSGSKKGK